MARFKGKVGYVITEKVNDALHPNKWVSKNVEKIYSGDTLKNVSKWQVNQDSTNDNITDTNSISIMADAFAYENFMHIRYIIFMGVKWKVLSVEPQRPRLILQIGGVYNG